MSCLIILARRNKWDLCLSSWLLIWISICSWGRRIKIHRRILIKCFFPAKLWSPWIKSKLRKYGMYRGECFLIGPVSKSLSIIKVFIGFKMPSNNITMPCHWGKITIEPILLINLLECVLLFKFKSKNKNLNLLNKYLIRSRMKLIC